MGSRGIKEIYVAEKRIEVRRKVNITTYIRKELPGGGFTLMQFISRDLSEGGIFISTDDLSLFDLGEELAVIVDRNNERLFEGKVRVVRSARIFESENEITDSGFGLMFLSYDSEFEKVIRERLMSIST